MEDFTELNSKLQLIIENLELLCLNEMAAWEGTDGIFEYYILDNEMYSHTPHVHVCVHRDNKHWKGKPLRSGNPFKTITSVKLKIQDIDNIEFEQIVDPKINTNSNKKIIFKWLQSKKLGITNHIKCLNDYLLQNDNFSNREQYQKYIDELG